MLDSARSVDHAKELNGFHCLLSKGCRAWPVELDACSALVTKPRRSQYPADLNH